MQLVPFKGGTMGIIFWDRGATIVLIRHEFAKKLGLKEQDVSQRIQVCGREFEDWETKAYLVTMIDKNDTKRRMKALGINTITSTFYPVDISGVSHLLKVPLRDVTRPAGPVNLLVSLNEAGLHPTHGTQNVEI